ncbi:MAG: heat-inducible transcriptional repressor HrcA [Candidatus Limnocylindrales bacterium]
MRGRTVARRKNRPAGPLDARSAAILRAVIEEYVSTATPVGSQTLVERYRLGVSSATVRNVMGDLEAAGYLRHPHTSAGRVPTDAGYRLYVEALDATTLTPVEELMIRHQFGQVEFASEHWFRLAASTLAGATHAAGLATPAKPRSARVSRVDLVEIGGRVASLVLVLAEGPIKHALLSLPEPVTREELEAAGRELSTRLAGRSARRVEELLPTLDRGDARARLVAHASERIARIMRDFDAAAVEDVFSEGLLNVMEEPEFAQSEKLRRVFTALQNRDYLGQLLLDVARRGGVRVFIGAENGPSEMHEVSLVVAPYGRAGRAMGVVGVLGPTRMAYPHTISTVRYVSGLMNELVDHLYAS